MTFPLSLALNWAFSSARVLLENRGAVRAACRAPGADLGTQLIKRNRIPSNHVSSIPTLYILAYYGAHLIGKRDTHIV